MVKCAGTMNTGRVRKLLKGLVLQNQGCLLEFSFNMKMLLFTFCFRLRPDSALGAFYFLSASHTSNFSRVNLEICISEKVFCCFGTLVKFT